MSVQEFKQWATERGIGLVDNHDGLKVGDVVTFTNEYGLSFPDLTVIGIADQHYDFYDRKFFLDKDAYWFPLKRKELMIQK